MTSVLLSRGFTRLTEVAVPDTKTVAEIWIVPDSVTLYTGSKLVDVNGERLALRFRVYFPRELSRRFQSGINTGFRWRSSHVDRTSRRL